MAFKVEAYELLCGVYNYGITVGETGIKNPGDITPEEGLEKLEGLIQKYFKVTTLIDSVTP